MSTKNKRRRWEASTHGAWLHPRTRITQFFLEQPRAMVCLKYTYTRGREQIRAGQHALEHMFYEYPGIEPHIPIPQQGPEDLKIWVENTVRFTKLQVNENKTLHNNCSPKNPTVNRLHTVVRLDVKLSKKQKQKCWKGSSGPHKIYFNNKTVMSVGGQGTPLKQ